MSTTLVKGENVIVIIFDGGLWKPYACGLSCTLTLTTDFIPTSVVGSGKWANFEPTQHSFTGSISGFVHLGIVNTLSLSDLRAKQIAQAKLLTRFQRTANNGLVYTDQIEFFISSSSDDGQNDGLNTFTVELKGTGQLLQIFTATPINPFGKVKRTPTFTASGGETAHVFTELIGKDLLQVGLDTREAMEIITSGTPADNQVAFAVATGEIKFPYALNATVQVFAMYQDI